VQPAYRQDSRRAVEEILVTSCAAVTRVDVRRRARRNLDNLGRLRPCETNLQRVKMRSGRIDDLQDGDFLALPKNCY